MLHFKVDVVEGSVTVVAVVGVVVVVVVFVVVTVVGVVVEVVGVDSSGFGGGWMDLSGSINFTFRFSHTLNTKIIIITIILRMYIIAR